MDFLTRLFDSSGFPARWQCGSGWADTPWIGWLHIFSDLGVWSAYLAIPLVLGYFIVRKRDLPFRRIFLLFGAFILACGTTHLVEAIIFWWPAYRLAGVIKLFTAIVSWATVVALVPVVPRVLAMRRPEELQREIEARKKAEAALRSVNDELEKRIENRTAELATAIEVLEKERERFHTTLACIGDAVIATDREGRVTFLNPMAQKLTGWQEDQAQGVPLETVFQIVNEQTRQPVENPAIRALNEGLIVGVANHTVLIARDGTERPIDDSAATIRDEGGEILGVVLVFRDVTDKKLADCKLRESEERVHELLEFHQTVITNLGEGLYTVDSQGLVTYINPTAERLLGWTSDELLGRKMHDTTHYKHPDGTPFPAEECSGFQVLHHGTVVADYEDVFIKKDGSFFPVVYSSSPLRSDEKIVGLVVAFQDVTERKRAEKNYRLLADVSAALVGPLEYQSILRQVAQLAVPTLGDFCIFDLLTKDDNIERVAWKHIDPEKEQMFGKVRALPSRVSETHPVSKVLRSGQAELTSGVSDEWLQSLTTSPEYLGFLRELKIGSMLTVPMLVAGRRLGALIFAYAESGRHYSKNDVQLATEIARRLALMIENAKLFDQLRDADRRKTEFLAVLAHELRNPLAPITNALELMRIKGEKDEAGPLRDMMARQVQQMVHLIDDLLDISRITSGKIVLRKERLDLAEVVKVALETSRPLIDEAKHELVVTMPAQAIPVEGDHTRLAQVLSNLLTNSAKYTTNGGRIWVSVSHSEQKALLRVRDTGIGIPSEMLPRIFDMFTQVDDTLRRSQGGLGIGLALVRSLVEMHGGTVEAKSDGAGKGSEFLVWLPLATHEQNQQGSKSEESAVDPLEPKSSGLRVLVVDDNKDAAESLAKLVKALGNEVHITYDGPSALEEAATFRPNVVLLDIGLPGMSGHDVARRMRQMPEVKDAVLVAQTGWGQDEDKRLSEEAGFNAHLVKPLDSTELRRLLAALPKGKPEPFDVVQESSEASFPASDPPADHRH